MCLPVPQSPIQPGGRYVSHLHHESHHPHSLLEADVLPPPSGDGVVHGSYRPHETAVGVVVVVEAQHVSPGLWAAPVPEMLAHGPQDPGGGWVHTISQYPHHGLERLGDTSVVQVLFSLEKHPVDCPTSPSKGAAPSFWENDSKLEDDISAAIPHILAVLTVAMVLNDVQRRSQERL